MLKAKMLKSKKARSVLAALAVLALAGAAIAYWSANGSGSGSAATASGTSALTANQTTALAAMYPGDSAQTISGNFDITNAGPVHVNTVTAAIASVTKAAGAPAGTCDATDYTLANATMTVNASVPAGSGQGAWTGATIRFNNKGTTNQDACKGATVNLSYTIA